MKKKILLVLLLIPLVLVFVGCKKNNEYDHKDMAKVVFHLEGGIYKTNEEKVVYYYPIEEDGSTYIADPNQLDKDDLVTRAKYKLVGWYRKKNADGTYSEPWNFEKDKITKDGIELYAYWLPNLVFSYELYYKDTEGEHLLGKYEVSQGGKFNDYMKYSKRSNYTLVGYYDEQGNPWDSNYTHPGGTQDTAIKVYAEYIEGDWEIVRTVEDLKGAKNSNIYLMNDLDLKGETLNFENYRFIFEGNNHTISNFKITGNWASNEADINPETNPNGENTSAVYNYEGLFRKTNKATIQNVTFEDVTFEVNTSNSRTQYIVVSPFAVETAGSTIKNVKFSCKVIFVKAPCEVECITDTMYYVNDESNPSKFDNVKYEVLMEGFQN